MYIIGSFMIGAPTACFNFRVCNINRRRNSIEAYIQQMQCTHNKALSYLRVGRYYEIHDPCRYHSNAEDPESSEEAATCI